MKHLIPVLSLLLVGCGSTNIVVDEKFTEEELVLIRHSVEEWYEASGSDDTIIYLKEHYNFGFGQLTEGEWLRRNDYIPLYKTYTYESVYSYFTDEFNNDYVAGAAEDGGKMALVWDNYTDNGKLTDWSHTVVLHEVGHFLSLEHGDGLVMAPGKVMPCIDRASLESLCDMLENCNNPKSTCSKELDP